MFVERTMKESVWYAASRLRNLAAQVATKYEDDDKPVIAQELVEISTLLKLVYVVLDRGSKVVVQSDDYVGDDEASEDESIPF